METRAAAKRKERSAGATSKPSDQLEQPPAKRTRGSQQANKSTGASAAGTARATSRGSQKGRKPASAAPNRSRISPDTATNTAASDQAQPVPKTEEEPAQPAKEPAPAAAAADMDKSGRRGSKGEPTSGGADDERVSGGQQWQNCTVLGGAGAGGLPRVC